MRAERILHKQSHVNYHGVHRRCRQAKLVRNQALYYLCQSFFNGKLMSWASADKRLKLHHSPLYNSLPAAMSQAIIKKLGDDFVKSPVNKGRVLQPMQWQPS